MGEGKAKVHIYIYIHVRCFHTFAKPAGGIVLIIDTPVAVLAFMMNERLLWEFMGALLFGWYVARQGKAL